MAPNSRHNKQDSTTSSFGPDLNPPRLKHNSYDFAEPSNALIAAFEIADTLEDYFSLARSNKLTEAQLLDFIKFVDNKRVFHTGMMVIQEIAIMTEAEPLLKEWVDSIGPDSVQVTRIMNAVTHRKNAHQELMPVPTKIDTPEGKAEFLRRAQKTIDATNASIAADEAAQDEAGNALPLKTQPCGWHKCTNLTRSRCARCKQVYYCSRTCQQNDWPRHKLGCWHNGRRFGMRVQNTGKVTTLGEMIRTRGEAGRKTWAQRHGDAYVATC